MERRHYHAIAELQAHNWWYASRRHLLDRLLARWGPFGTALEVGCGLGANLEVLQRHCDRVIATDFDFPALGFCRQRTNLALFRADLGALPISSASFDLIVAMDVLEHVDDRRAIAEISGALAPGGLLVLSVPAHAFLWNDNDVASHHLRRYSASGLRTLLSGWHIEHFAPWNALTFLPMAVFAWWRRRRPVDEPRNNLERVPAMANRTLLGLSRLENRLRDWLPTPVGTSFVAVARRTEGMA